MWVMRFTLWHIFAAAWQAYSLQLACFLENIIINRIKDHPLLPSITVGFVSVLSPG